MEKPILGPPSSTGKSKPNSSDEKAPDSSDNGIKRAGWPKGKKRKKVSKDSSDPQKPLSAYHWFIKENREKIRNDNPSLGFTEISKKLAQDWKALTVDQKQQYTVSAEEDKERYARELTIYKQTDAYKAFVKNQKNKSFNKKIKESSAAGSEEPLDKDDGTGFDIPIFTEEFLDHNKAREAELRLLRKSNTDYEQQNTILEKLIENSKSYISKLEEEIIQQRCQNASLQQYLETLRLSLTKAFSQVPISDLSSPTVETIDSYMAELHNILLLKSTNWPHYGKVCDIIKKLDLLG